MVVCRFWQRGDCRNGNDCRFDHPGSNRPQSFSRPKNAFEVFNRDSPGHGSNYRSNEGAPRFGENVPANTYKLDPETIRKDLAEECPEFIFSCYGPGGRDAPRQLWGGELRERSPEEMRLRYYELASQGNVPDAQGEENSMRVSAQEQISMALRDIQGAVKYIRDGENVHPNRIDVVEGRLPNESQPGFNNSTTPSGPFGEPNPTANAGNSFGWTQPANPGQSTFGQTSSLGQSQSPFASNPVAQAQPQQSPGPFQTGASQNPFNQSAPVNAPAFQPAPTQVSAPQNPFAQPPGALLQPSNPFATANGGTANPNPFAAANGGTAGSNPFAAAVGATGNTNPFAIASPNPNPFAANGGASNPFATANSGTMPDSSAIGRSLPTPTSMQNGAGANGAGNKQSSGDPRTWLVPNEKLASWQGFRVQYGGEDGKEASYTDGRGKRHRIFNPIPKPADWYEPRVLGDPPLELYTDEVKEQLQFLKENRAFKGGLMPELPLLKAETNYDI